MDKTSSCALFYGAKGRFLSSPAKSAQKKERMKDREQVKHSGTGSECRSWSTIICDFRTLSLLGWRFLCERNALGSVLEGWAGGTENWKWQPLCLSGGWNCALIRSKQKLQLVWTFFKATMTIHEAAKAKITRKKESGTSSHCHWFSVYLYLLSYSFSCWPLIPPSIATPPPPTHTHTHRANPGPPLWLMCDWIVPGGCSSWWTGSTVGQGGGGRGEQGGRKGGAPQEHDWGGGGLGCITKHVNKCASLRPTRGFWCIIHGQRRDPAQVISYPAPINNSTRLSRKHTYSRALGKTPTGSESHCDGNAATLIWNSVVLFLICERLTTSAC